MLKITKLLQYYKIEINVLIFLMELIKYYLSE